MSGIIKRKYKSGASKRKRIKNSIKNTNAIDSYCIPTAASSTSQNINSDVEDVVTNVSDERYSPNENN